MLLAYELSSNIRRRSTWCLFWTSEAAGAIGANQVRFSVRLIRQPQERYSVLRIVYDVYDILHFCNAATSFFRTLSKIFLQLPYFDPQLRGWVPVLNLNRNRVRERMRVLSRKRGPYNAFQQEMYKEPVPQCFLSWVFRCNCSPIICTTSSHYLPIAFLSLRSWRFQFDYFCLWEKMAVSTSEFSFYHYDPTSVGAIIFIILFFLTTILHFYQLLRTRSWFMIPMVVGGCRGFSQIYLLSGMLMNLFSWMDWIYRSHNLSHANPELDSRPIHHSNPLPARRTRTLRSEHLYGIRKDHHFGRWRIARFDQEEMADEVFRLRRYHFFLRPRGWWDLTFSWVTPDLGLTKIL